MALALEEIQEIVAMTEAEMEANIDDHFLSKPDIQNAIRLLSSGAVVDHDRAFNLAMNIVKAAFMSGVEMGSFSTLANLLRRINTKMAAEGKG